MGFLAGTWTNRKQRNFKQQESEKRQLRHGLERASHSTGRTEYSMSGNDRGGGAVGNNGDDGEGGGATMVLVVLRTGRGREK